MSCDIAPATSTMDDDETVWFCIFGAALHPKMIPSTLPRSPLATTETVRIKDAWLGFTCKGVPYVEPCLANAIVKGVNDEGARHLSEYDAKDDDRKRWVWERCCPGLDFTGLMPPSLEGVAYKLTLPEFENVKQSMSNGTKLVKVKAVMFSSITEKESQEIDAYLPVLSNRVSEPGFQPTLRYLRLVLLGAHFSSLSQPFLGHLSLIRPFKPDLTRRKLVASWIITTLMLPRYLFVHLPLTCLSRLSPRARWVDSGARVVSSLAERLEASVIRFVERVLRLAAGSGYRNEGEGGMP
ncbi:hypothetical protein ACM66B_001249 [Microbotryomycetes sp. NB124-2]